MSINLSTNSYTSWLHVGFDLYLYCLHLYVCVYIYMHVCLHVCVYVCMYVCMYGIFTCLLAFGLFTRTARTPIGSVLARFRGLRSRKRIACRGFRGGAGAQPWRPRLHRYLRYFADFARRKRRACRCFPRMSHWVQSIHDNVQANSIHSHRASMWRPW